MSGVFPILSRESWKELADSDKEVLPTCCHDIENLRTAAFAILDNDLSVTTATLFCYHYNLCLVRHNLKRSQELTDLHEACVLYCEIRKVPYAGKRSGPTYSSV